MSARRPIIILTGFSGTGKTAAAPLIAERIGWKFIDTDEIVEQRAGKPILAIFRDEGEEAFRDRESLALAEACSRTEVIVATGGGAILRPENRRRMAEAGLIVCLEARPETILRRLHDRAEEEPLDRPLLASADPLSRIRDLKLARQPLYALCDWAVHTDLLSPEQVANEVIRACEVMPGTVLTSRQRIDEISGAAASGEASVTLHAVGEGTAAVVNTSMGACPIFVQWGLLSELGQRLKEAGLDRQAYVIADETVAHYHEKEIVESLTKVEIPHEVYTIPPGEDTKTLASASDIYDFLLERNTERSHTIVALGGGVTTDLAGYAAATFARGIPLVNVPTSVLGMADASIGGKVAVNHPKAKNMIGSFYHPRMVLIDPALLRTLQPRELSGWAEAIKHALIADEGYLSFFERNAAKIMKLDPELVTEAIRRSAVIKARVVSEDERETKGVRTLLNYGHTLAHAIESTTDYRRFRHGEADGIGMVAAAAMSVRMGLLDADEAARQKLVLRQFGLPTEAEGLDRDSLKAAMALDKKVQGKAIRWVLLEGIGNAIVRDDVPAEIVESALDEVLT